MAGSGGIWGGRRPPQETLLPSLLSANAGFMVPYSKARASKNQAFSDLSGLKTKNRQEHNQIWSKINFDTNTIIFYAQKTGDNHLARFLDCKGFRIDVLFIFRFSICPPPPRSLRSNGARHFQNGCCLLF